MRFVALGTAVLLAACSGDVAPPVEVTGLRVFAPLPGTHASVAYFDIANNTDEPLHIESVTSPQFGSAMIHRSSLDDGVARMHAVERIEVPARASVTLAEGGLHVMLSDSRMELSLGDDVTLVLTTSSGSDIILRTGLRSRVSVDAGESS